MTCEFSNPTQKYSCLGVWARYRSGEYKGGKELTIPKSIVFQKMEI